MTDTFASGPAPTFASRHIGLRPEDEGKMLADLGYASARDLLRAAVPGSIRVDEPLALPGPLTEEEIEDISPWRFAAALSPDIHWLRRVEVNGATGGTTGVLLLLLVGGFALTGCTDNARYEAIKEDPAPNILTLDERVEDADNNWTISRNENWRMFWQDMGRAFYTDRPSRLTREPVPRP